MRNYTPVKLTMAVAVSWGVFLGASIVGHAAEDINADDVTPEENEADTETVEENHQDDASSIGVIEPIENNSDGQKSEDDVEEVDEGKNETDVAETTEEVTDIDTDIEEIEDHKLENYNEEADEKTETNVEESTENKTDDDVKEVDVQTSENTIEEVGEQESESNIEESGEQKPAEKLEVSDDQKSAENAEVTNEQAPKKDADVVQEPADNSTLEPLMLKNESLDMVTLNVAADTYNSDEAYSNGILTENIETTILENNEIENKEDIIAPMMLRSAAPKMMALSAVADTPNDAETLNSASETTPEDTTESEEQNKQMVPVELPRNAAEAEQATMHLTISILSDTHYVSNDQKQGAGIDNMDVTSVTEMRMLEEIDSIINVTLKQVTDVEPDCLLICGDLTSNGEYSGAQALADKLNALKQTEGMEDVGIYVVNGNHDINNSYAADLTTADITAADRISPDDFKTVFAGLGYGENDHCEGGTRTVYNPEGDDPSVAQNHGGLSYSTEIADGVTLVVMDTGIYSYQDMVNSRYADAQKTAGYISEGLLQWVVEQTTQAKEKGNLVLGMCHHSVMPHYTVSSATTEAFMADYVIPNHKEVSTALADAGMSAVLTGHSHANDIAKFVSEKGNVLYDIQTAALCAYPVAWRTVNIDIKGNGKDAEYTFSIDTTFLDKDFEDVDTSEWTVSTGGQVKSFDNDFDGSMQEYSYEKSGIRQETIEPFLEYFARETAYAMAENPDGFEGYVQDKLKIEGDETLGSYAVKQGVEYAKNNASFATEVTLPYLGKVSVSASRLSDGSADSIIKYAVSFNDAQKEEKGVLQIDLTGVANGIETMVNTINEYLDVDGWKESNYKISPIQKEVDKLITTVLTKAMSKPIDEKDPTTTGFNIAIDAQQGFARGDEGATQTEKRARYQELLRSEKFESMIKENMWDAIVDAAKMNSQNYPLLSGILATSIAPEGKKTIAEITDVSSQSRTYITLINGLLSSANSPSSMINLINAVAAYNKSAIPNLYTKQLANAFADIQASFTQDTNIPNDSKWSFHTVNLYAFDDYKISNTLTIEDFRAGGLYTPSREDYEFEGWYTAPDGGTLVTADSDFTSIYKVYAHWNYTGEDIDDRDWDDYDKNDDWERIDDDDDYWDDLDQVIEDDGVTKRDYVKTENEVKKNIDEVLELIRRLKEDIIDKLNNTKEVNILVPDSTTALPDSNTQTEEVTQKNDTISSPQIVIVIKENTDKPKSVIPENKSIPLGATAFLRYGNTETEIKIGRYINDTIVDGQGNTVTDKVFVTDTGRLGINIGKLDYLTPSLLKTLKKAGVDIEIYFMYNGKLSKLVIPRGVDLSKYADKNGFIGILYLKKLIESGQLI